MTISLDRPQGKQFIPVQLELPVIDAMGKPRADGCKTALLNFKPSLSGAESALMRRLLIPGLDATLCRCEGCSSKDAGVWWFSQQMRDRILSRKTIMRNASADGEALRDSE